MKLQAFLLLGLLMSVSVFAAGVEEIPSPDGTRLGLADCRGLFLGERTEDEDGLLVTAVVCRDDLTALEAFFGGPVGADVLLLSTRGEAAEFCECHCGCVWLRPV